MLVASQYEDNGGGSGGGITWVERCPNTVKGAHPKISSTDLPSHLILSRSIVISLIILSIANDLRYQHLWKSVSLNDQDFYSSPTGTQPPSAFLCAHALFSYIRVDFEGSRKQCYSRGDGSWMETEHLDCMDVEMTSSGPPIFERWFSPTLKI